MPREKGPDEVFCRSCGEPIKRAAELCPECGVRNDLAASAGATSSSSRETAPGQTTHDPDDYETAVSDSWYLAIVAGLVLWVLGFALGPGTQGGALGDLGGFAFLLGWFATPVGVYYDSRYVRANSDWKPNATVFVLLTLLWFANVIAGLAYLYRRHEVLGVP